MNGRSPNSQNSRFSSGTPTRSHTYGARQPLYLQPNCNYMSPKGSRMSSPKNNSASPDFLPLGVSSPVNRARRSWGQRNQSNSSSLSGWSSPPSSNSSVNFSPGYNMHGSRGNFRRRGSFNNSSISVYVDREALEDPWAELEKKMNLLQRQQLVKPVEQQEKSEIPIVVQDSDPDVSSDDGEDDNIENDDGDDS